LNAIRKRPKGGKQGTFSLPYFSFSFNLFLFHFLLSLISFFQGRE